MKIHAAEARKSLERVESEIMAAIKQSLGQAANVAVREAKATNTFKDRTGHLRDSIQRENLATKVRVKVGAKYAGFVEAGTNAHVIAGRGGGMLRFVVNGATIFRRKVKHPGTKATNFMQTARDAAEWVLDATIDANISRAIQAA